MICNVHKKFLGVVFFVVAVLPGIEIVGQEVQPVETKKQIHQVEFDAPLLLRVGKQPLNSNAKQMYPSPAMFDVDNDGQVELIVGDIFGSLNVYENTNADAKGDPVWSNHTPLKTVESKPIKVSNW